MKFTYLKCSRCGKQVSTALSYEGHDIVVRAWIECPECLEAEANIPSDDDLPQLTESMRARMESLPDDLVERLWNESLSAAGGRGDDMSEEATCASCTEGIPTGECPKSKRSCGHHCNCSWTQDYCHWCGKEFGAVDELPAPPAGEEGKE